MSQPIIDNIEKAIAGVDKAIEWNDHYHQDRELQLLLIQNKLQLINCRGLDNPKSTNAVYGESQVGKSTFISNFIGNADNKLVIEDEEGHTYDFIEKINPVGDGQEATGVVTRFTTSNNNSGKITLKLLSSRDIILIFLDSYLNDFKQWKNEPIEDAIHDFIESSIQSYEINSKPSNPKNKVLTSDDIYFIQYYLDYYYKSSPLKVRINPFFQADYWRSLAIRIENIPLEDYGKIFSILWGQNIKISEAFDLLINQLRQLEFSESVECDKEVILRETGAGLLDVARVLRIFDNDMKVRVRVNGKEISVFRNVLSVLTSEVVLQFRNFEEPADNNDIQLKERLDLRKDVITKCDFLDFPGIRTRLTLDENHELTDNSIGEMILRGKVEYLFNKFDLTSSLDNFFVVTVKENVAVQGFRDKLNAWINANLGSNKIEREQYLQSVPISPLFIIFNKWDEVIKQNSKISKGEMENELWSKVRLALEDNVYLKPNVPDRWHESWSVSNPRFHNIYPFRSIKYSKEAFDEKDGVELLYEGDYHDFLKESFLNSDTVHEIFGDKLRDVWAKSSMPNQDGCDNLLQNVILAADPTIKFNKYKLIFEKSTKRLVDALYPHFESDSQEERIAAAVQKMKKINQELEIRITSKPAVFGQLIENLIINETKVFNLFNRILQNLSTDEEPVKDNTKSYIIIRKSCDFVEKIPGNKVESDQKNLEILREHWGEESIKIVVQRCEEENFDLELLFYGSIEEIKGDNSPAKTLAQEAVSYWKQNVLNAESFLTSQKNDLPEPTLLLINNILKEGAEKLSLSKSIEKLIGPLVNRLDNAIPIKMVAHLSAGIINKFATSAGWSFFTNEDKRKISDLSKHVDFHFFKEVKEVTHNEISGTDIATPPTKRQIGELFDLEIEDNKDGIDSILPYNAQFTNWRDRLAVLAIRNTDAKSPKPGNGELGALIEDLKIPFAN